MRASRISRLPGPSSHAGLSEMNEAQTNTRVASSSIPGPGGKGVKREIPQPAAQPDAKRKLLSERALEYPKPSPGHNYYTRANVGNVKGHALTGLSQVSAQAVWIIELACLPIETIQEY